MPHDVDAIDPTPRPPQTIAVSGASGFIGRAVCAEAEAAGHRVVRFVRPSSPRHGAGATIDWDPDSGRIDAAALESVDVVIHLAGEGIAEKRWTADQKRRIVDSRTAGTRLIADTLAALDSPTVLLSGSAVGFYGDTGSDAVDEASPPGSGFLTDVVTAWEAATEPASGAGLRVAHLRTGVVYDPHGGALARQLPFFRMGLGGKVLPGTQYIPWISLRDEVRAILFLTHTDISGPVNLVSPGEATNAEVTRALGRALHRPTTILPITGPRLLFGRELADNLLKMSQRVRPTVLEAVGFEFLDLEIDTALAHMLG